MTIAEHNRSVYGASFLNLNAKNAEYLIQQLTVLVVEDNSFMRNVVRGLM